MEFGGEGRKTQLTMLLSCVVLCPLFDDPNQPKALVDNVAINIDVFSEKKKLNDSKETN